MFGDFSLLNFGCLANAFCLTLESKDEDRAYLLSLSLDLLSLFRICSRVGGTNH